jgi:hypothetical protein
VPVSARRAVGRPAPVSDALLDVTKQNDIVIDPFCGSGATVLAAERTGRRGYGVEIDPLYVDTTIARWEKMTGRQACHASGKTFAEFKAGRAEDGVEASAKNAVDNGVNLRKVGRDRIGITADERTRPPTLEAVWRAFGGYNLVYRDEFPKCRLPAALIRQSAYLTHPVFHMNRAESEMTRYMRRLADRDLALDRAMIPLGSSPLLGDILKRADARAARGCIADRRPGSLE